METAMILILALQVVVVVVTGGLLAFAYLFVVRPMMNPERVLAKKEVEKSRQRREEELDAEEKKLEEENKQEKIEPVNFPDSDPVTLKNAPKSIEEYWHRRTMQAQKQHEQAMRHALIEHKKKMHLLDLREKILTVELEDATRSLSEAKN